MLDRAEVAALQAACRTPAAADAALGAVLRDARDEASILPELLRLTGESREVAANTPAVKKLCDSVCSRPFALVVLCVEASSILILIFGYAVLVYELRAESQNSRYVASLGAVVATSGATGLREVAHVARLARYGLLDHYFRDPLRYVGLLSVSWVGVTLATPKGSRDLDIVGAAGAVLFAARLLAFLRELSIRFARFVVALQMIVVDSATFLVVLLISLVGFSEAHYFLTARRGASVTLHYSHEDHDDEENDGKASPQGVLILMYSILLGEIDAAREFNDYAFLFFLAFTFIGVIVLLNVLIAIVSDSYDKAQAKNKSLFGLIRLEVAAELVLIIPHRFLADAALPAARGDMVRLLAGSVPLDAAPEKEAAARDDAAPAAVGGPRAFVSSTHGYGAGGALFLACMLTVFLPITLLWLGARALTALLGGDPRRLDPERILSHADDDDDEESADVWLGRMGEIERLVKRSAVGLEVKLDAATRASGAEAGALEARLSALEAHLASLAATSGSVEAKLDAILRRLDLEPPPPPPLEELPAPGGEEATVAAPSVWSACSSPGGA